MVEFQNQIIEVMACPHIQPTFIGILRNKILVIGLDMIQTLVDVMPLNKIISTKVTWLKNDGGRERWNGENEWTCTPQAA